MAQANISDFHDSFQILKDIGVEKVVEFPDVTIVKRGKEITFIFDTHEEADTAQTYFENNPYVGK